MRRAFAVGAGTAALVWLRAFAYQAPPAPPASGAAYHLEAIDPKTLSTRYTAQQIALLEKLNRRDLEHLLRLKEIIAPDEWLDDELSYSPLPREWAWAGQFPKALVVDQPSQVFGAYASGQLVRWGPVSTGRQETPTPSGVYNLNWKSKSRTSTDNDQWLLKWYFNFINSRGVSFHQFELPGLPLSHACVRLLERDAQWVYDWGEQWTFGADRRNIVTPGTPVVVLGTFDYRRPAPWLALEWWRAPIELPVDPKR